MHATGVLPAGGGHFAIGVPLVQDPLEHRDHVVRSGLDHRQLPRQPVPHPVGAVRHHQAAGEHPLHGHHAVQAQHELVEPLYELEKAGKLNHDDQPANPGGRAFIEQQLLAGGEMLGRLWYTAWRSAAPDPYLRAQLLKKQAAGAK